MIKLVTHFKLEIETAPQVVETFNIGYKLLSQQEHKKLASFRQVKSKEWQSKLAEVRKISKIVQDETSTPEQIITATEALKEYEDFNQDTLLEDIAKQEFKTKLIGDTKELEKEIAKLHNGYSLVMAEVEKKYSEALTKK